MEQLILNKEKKIIAYSYEDSVKLNYNNSIPKKDI